MSDENPIKSKNPSADDLTKTTNPGDVQLNEEELSNVSGGGTPTQDVATQKTAPLDVLKLKPW